ncbi:hypothetical protein OpiT1DRAFT_02279 [Opitutaceae bacterium TAV1]|nr:hypothetical protein OpiT1DRAFT_02279 [Opitutaceae bacterium TAV1]
MSTSSSLPASVVAIHDAMLDLLWKQWTVLGVAGAASPEDTRWCVDIEALVLASANLARSDPRLFDEMLDWLRAHAQWVNLQRLRNIRKTPGLGDARVLAAVSGWLGQRSALAKWKKLAAELTAEVKAGAGPATRGERSLESTGAQPVEAAVPLFVSRHDGAPQPVYGMADPVFLKYGWSRGVIRPRSLSRAPNPNVAAALSWKLRAFFGVQARCEIVHWLLTHPNGGRAAEVARATCYFPRTVEDALRELAASGLVQVTSQGRERHYQVREADWSFLRSWSRPDGFPPWQDWPRFFALFEKLNAVLIRFDLSPALRASELRRVFDESSGILIDGGLAGCFPNVSRQRGNSGNADNFTAAVTTDLSAFLAQK